MNKSSGKNSTILHPISADSTKLSKIIFFLKKIFFKKNKQNKIKKAQASQLEANLLNNNSNEIIFNINSFSLKTAEQIMIPRSDIISVSVDVNLQDLCKAILEHGHTRTLVFNEKLDNIVGFVHIKDLFEVIATSKKFNLKKLMRKPIISPQSIKLFDLLTQMQATRTHIAVVVDEYGGTDGIVTIEDIIEEIVGKIADEHDIEHEEAGFKIFKPGIIITNSRVEVSEIEKAIGVKFKRDEEIETIGGLIMAISGSVPEKGEVITLQNGIEAKIIESTPRTIKKIKVIYANN